MNNHGRFLFQRAAAILFAALCVRAPAQVVLWQVGNSVLSDLLEPSNWDSNTVPGVGDIISFGATGDQGPILAANATVGGLEFTSTAQGYTLGNSNGAVLTIGSSGIVNNASVAETISAPLVFAGGSQSISNAGTLTLSGAITNNTTTKLELTGAGLNGIASGGMVGSGALLKSGSGTWTLTGSVGHTGGTTINGGMLQIGSGLTDGVLSGPVSVASGASLVFNPATNTRFDDEISGAGSVVKESGAAALTLGAVNTYTGGTTIKGGTLTVLNSTTNSTDSGTGTGTVTVMNGAVLQIGDSSSNGKGSVAGPIANDGTVFFNRPDSFTHAGQITGGGAVSVVKGTVSLTAANTYNGGTTVADGATLALDHLGGGTLTTGADITLNGTGALLVDEDQEIRGLISSSATSTATIATGKALTINLPDATDTLHTNATFAGVIGGNGALTMGGPGTFTVTGTNTYKGGTALNGGTLVITSDANLGDAAGNLSFNGGTLRASGSFAVARPVLLNANGGTIDAFTSNGVVEFSGQFTGTGGLKVQSQATNGIVLLTNTANQYAGGTHIVSGRLKVGAANALPTDNAVTIDSGATLDVSADQTIATLTGPGGTTIAAGKKLTIGGAGATLYNGAISGSGSLERAGVGAGTLTLAGNNSYGGDTLVTAGSIADNMSGAFSSNSTVRVNTGATLQVTYNETIAGLDDYATGASGTVSIGNSGWLTVSNAAANTFTGALAGAGSFSKSGAGELIFGGSSSYNGSVTISAGKLTVGATNAFTANAVTVNNTAIFNVANSTAVGSLTGAGTTTVAAGQTLTLKTPLLFTGVIGGTGGAVTFENNNNSSGLTTLTADQTYTGVTTVTTGSLQFGNGGASGSVSGNIVSGNGTKVIYSHGSANVTEANSISGGGSLVKNGAGVLTLTGSHSYSGSTTITTGTLKVSGQSNVLPAASKVAVGTAAGANAVFDVAEDQTIAGFLSSFADSQIVIEATKVLNVTLGANPGAGTQFNGVITGPGKLQIGNTGGYIVALGADSNYSGGTTIDTNGVLQLGLDSTAGMVNGNIANDGLLRFAHTNNFALSSVISGNGAVHQVSSGEAKLLAANTYVGGTKIYAGKLLAANLSGSATGTGAVDVYSTGLLGGNGTITGAVNIHSGGSIAPAVALGAPATLHVGATTFEGGGEFVFQIKDANGSPGTDLSLLAISGALTVTATHGSPFNIDLYSVDGTAVAALANFNAGQSYSWKFATASGGVTGFDATAFTVTLNSQNFLNDPAGGFFGVSNIGNDLFVNFTPAAVPEPSTWALLGMGLAVLVFGGRRVSLRRKQG